MKTASRYTAAVVQHPPVFLDRAATIDRLESLTAEAAREGAKLVAFSESFIPGYPIWVFGTGRWEDPLGKRLFRELAENALEIPSPELARLQAAAAENEVVLVVGVTERDARFSRTSLFNSLVYIDETGALLGVHRKLMPTDAERLIWSYGDASGLRAHDTCVGRLGGLICYEHWMPLPRFALHACGEQVHVAVWPEVTETYHLASRHYAFEGRTYVLCVGQFLRGEDLPDDQALRAAIHDGVGDLGGAEGVIQPVSSGIIGPDGSWIAGPAEHEPTIVYGEIDLDRLVEEKEVLDTAGHYHRPDIFSVSVDRRPRPPIEFSDGGVVEQSSGAAPGGGLEDEPQSSG
jgi:predicted amidohydrolase